MSKRRHHREQPAFPFPFGTNVQEPSAGSVIAAELQQDIGPALVQLLAEVESWLEAPATNRRLSTDFPDLHALPAELATRAGRTFELLREESDQHTQEAVALALVWTGEWIETEGGAIRAAIVFHQAALLILPDNVPLPYHIGRLLRQVAMYDDAEAWLLHTADKAAAAGNWQHHALALSGTGNLKRERGNFPESVRFHRMALDSARKHGVRRLEGDALYDLAVMHFERGELDEGMRHAFEAINAYGPGHGQLVRMANDLGWIWMHLHGEAGLALTLFQAIEPRVQDPAFRCVLLANITRAAAEVEQEHIYELGWLETYGYMRKQDTEDGHAAAFCQLALAALASTQLERARQAASLCMDVAQRRRETHSIYMASQILDALKNGLPAPAEMKELFPAFTLEEVEVNPVQMERDEDFVAALGIAVRTRRDGAPESPVRALIRGK
jgi:tetratricopeptide (TPR) repeat protein